MNNRFSSGAACATLILISGCSLMHRKLDCVATRVDQAPDYEGRRFELVIHSPSKEFGGETGRGKLNYKDRLNGSSLSIDARMSVDLLSPDGLMPGMGEPGDEAYFVYSELDPFGMELLCKN